jgi:hypothetical protein
VIISYLAFRVLCRLLPALVCLAFAADLTAQTKVIHLRNGALTNEPPVVQPRTQATVPAPVSGLYLVQFTGPVRPEWRAELATLGAQLVRYVPDDAFITRFNGTPIELVRAKSYVFFAGEYPATHKVHSSIGDQLRAGPAVQTLNVRIVLSPVATLTERAEVHRRMGAFRGLSRNRFGDILQGDLPVGQLAAVLNSPAVLWMEGPANMRLSDEIASKIVGGGIYGTPGAPHLTDVQRLGYTGAGVTVAVADSGLHNGDAASMHPDLAGRVTAFFYYGDLFDAADEHAHGTHVTGIIAGNAATREADERGAWYGLGVAPEAHIVAQRMFDSIGLYKPPDSMEQLTRDAVRAGAEIGSNSWGDDARGRYDTFAAEFDALTRDADFETPGDQPYILEFSAGNSGPVSSSINTPAVAKNVIATGASQNDRFDFFIYAEGSEVMADFSSRGPAEDGRIKPDLVAPGTWIASLQSASASDANSWLGISQYYQYQGGTSQAGPHVSGAAAAFVQYYRELNDGLTPSPALVKAALINSAWDMDDRSGTIATPNMDEGWGRVDLVNLINGFGRRDFIDQTELLTTGEVYEHRALVVDSFEPLVITLTYTDVPGLPASIPALVNNLDLVVTAPDGQVYHGNRFDSFGLSVPGPATGDRINNVEGIYIDSPTPGEWVIQVIAQGVFEDARIDTAEIDQDFALVVSAFLPPPNAAVLLLDRSAYRAPSEIKLKVFDFDVLEATTVTVRLNSSTEPAGFPVTLHHAGVSGIFTGTVATATAPAVPGDGILQIADGDLIRTTYFDESRNVTESAQAVGDFQPPRVLFAGVTNQLGRTFVLIEADESTRVRVFYGTNPPPTQPAFGAATASAHKVELRNLEPFEVYYVAVELTDIAGNVTYYDAGGAYVRFVALPPATVLLVNAYTDDPPDSDTPPIPLSAYTQSLAETGVTFEVWDKATMGPPTLDALSPFRVVIWRINDSIWTAGDSLNANEQTTITSYLNNGGGFFISSMELLSRMGSTTFRTNVLQVQEFLPNTDPFGEPCADCDEDFRVPVIIGEDYDLISDGVVADLDYSAYPFIDFSEIGIVLGPDFSDTFTPTTNAVSIFYEPNDKTCGIRFPRVGTDSPGRVVFLSFPLDTIPRDGTTSGRTAVLGNALRFLAPGLNGLGSIALDNFEYTIPDQVIVEVADSDLEGLPSAAVTFFSSAAPAGVTVTLTETITPGLFRGFLTLVGQGEPAGPGRLPVTTEDVISARYFDESVNVYRTTFAVIDVIPPEIYNVVVEPQYTEAVVAWEVSEYTDGVVEFSESPFFQGQTFRTAANPRFFVAHSLLLTGLKPNQLYHYRIVCRDVAGNTTILATGPDGRPLTFTTLEPVKAPWLDDLEFTGQYDWDVFSADETEGRWELGIIPAADGGAHSGNVVWATNIRREAQGYVESFLISPPIEITGGNRATLKFWQDYDFFDYTENTLIEFGQLLLLTNSVSRPLVLAQYYDWSSFGWEEQEFDLSPHIGKVVYVVWYYGYFSIENERKRGWRIDDISVTVEQITPGELTIASSLAQGMFNISGPLNRTRHPWFFHDGNAPPGDYQVTFVGVPYYQTPAAQFETLEPGGVLHITGNYTIVDTNNNGIADSWEQQFFGTVSPAHPADLDSDGDGLSDLHEFLLGTIPTNAASALKLSTPLRSANNVVQVNWPATLGRAYRLESSDATLDWSPVVDWYRSLSNSGTYKQVAPTNGALLFRLQAQP